MTLSRWTIASAWALSGVVVWAQPAPPRFEVGTVKVSEPTPGVLFSVVPVYPGVRNGLFTARYASLLRLVAYANDISEVQVTGPGWLDKKFYDVTAKLPEGAALSDVRAMLREFLAERFHVVAHRATQEMDALALVVSAGGIKLEPLEAGATYKPNIPDGASILMNRDDMRSWSQSLTRVMGTPVIDQTGLVGPYPGVVAYSAYDRDRPGDFPSFPTALKEQTGLELVRRKMAVEMVVVDRADEVPEEN